MIRNLLLSIAHRLAERHRERLRRIDLEILWPECRRLAPDIKTARAAFAAHAIVDRAWVSLGMVELRRRIDALT